jgi:DNA-binding PadR family transcriptional regulator
MHWHKHQHDDRQRDGDDHRHMHAGFGFGSRHGRHEHRGRQGGRIRRVFDQAPRHGYELIKAIEEKFGGTYSPSPGVVYPTLTLLEELGFIRPEATDGPRKQFVITAEGTAFLAANKAIVDQIFARMDEIGRAYAGGPAPEIRRAMQNLEAALTIRLGRGPLTADQVRAVTVSLDRAAGEIEQG